MRHRTFAAYISFSLLLSPLSLAQRIPLAANGDFHAKATVINAVPRVIRVTTLNRRTSSGAPSPLEGATLSIYRDEVGGTPLWQETQNMTLDADGHYTVMLGSMSKDGIPLDLFGTTEPRWLGIQFNRAGEIEQPRVLLGSVPYALKAADAETLGGRPATDYLLAPAAGTTASTEPSAPTTIGAPGKLGTRVTSGTAGFIAQFVNSTDLGNSGIFQNGNFLGIGTTAPSYGLDFFSSLSGAAAAVRIGNGTTDNRMRVESNQPYALGMKSGVGGTYAWMGVTASGHYQFSDQNGTALVTIQQGGNVGIGTTSPQSKLDVVGDVNLTGIVRFQNTPVLQVAGVAANSNVALGPLALPTQATGTGNLAIGYAALASDTTGSNNTAVGANSLLNTSSGSSNTAYGNGALQLTTTGCCNVAVGFHAMGTNTGGSNNIAIGIAAGTGVAGNNSNNIDIGHQGLSGDSGIIRIGSAGTQTAFFAAGIRGVTTGSNDAVSVVIDSNGQLGTVSSSRRFKEDIQDMGSASRALMRLRPVTYRYRQPFADGSKPVQYGLIAEEVAEVYPDLVAHSANGQIETVKYQVLDSMLLNEVQRQDGEIQRLQRELVLQQEQNRQLLDRLSRLETAVTSLVADPENKRQ